jgi:hypothetical protein
MVNVARSRWENVKVSTVVTEPASALLEELASAAHPLRDEYWGGCSQHDVWSCCWLLVDWDVGGGGGGWLAMMPKTAFVLRAPRFW